MLSPPYAHPTFLNDSNVIESSATNFYHRTKRALSGYGLFSRGAALRITGISLTYKKLYLVTNVAKLVILKLCVGMEEELHFGPL
jgi:hypothetical protein